MATRKNSNTDTENTESPKSADAGKAQAAVQAYGKAQKAMADLQAKHEKELAKAHDGVGAALKALHEAVGGGWFEIDGQLVCVRRNKFGFYLREFPQERPTAAVSLST